MIPGTSFTSRPACIHAIPKGQFGYCKIEDDDEQVIDLFMHGENEQIYAVTPVQQVQRLLLSVGCLDLSNFATFCNLYSIIDSKRCTWTDSHFGLLPSIDAITGSRNSGLEYDRNAKTPLGLSTRFTLDRMLRHWSNSSAQ